MPLGNSTGYAVLTPDGVEVWWAYRASENGERIYGRRVERMSLEELEQRYELSQRISDVGDSATVVSARPDQPR